MVPTSKAGLIGLGVMGSAMARHLIEAGFETHGVDPDRQRAQAFEALGGHLCADARQVWQASDVVIACLPSAAALHQVVESVAASGKPGPILIETSTLALDDKLTARARMDDAGLAMMDAPLSGSGAQAQVRDVLVYASGSRTDFDQCLPVLQAFSRAPHYVGEYGQGSRLKYIANHLVAIHTAAGAEAFALARRVGLDPQQMFDLVSDGAGSSRALGVRGSMWVADRYLPTRTMSLDLWAKDLRIIGEFAANAKANTPLFNASVALFQRALALGFGPEDTAAVVRAIEAGHRDK